MSNPYSRIRRAQRRRESSHPDDTSHAILPPGPCETCGGTGWIGGPSYYDPGEGGEPCPDCDGSGVARMQEG